MSIPFYLLFFLPIISALTFPQQYYPAKVSFTPRLWIKNDLPRLTQVYSDATTPGSSIFIKEVNKMMSYTTACADWRCESGWPVAALALAWRLTGDPAYGVKAINTYLPHFDGVPHVYGRLQSITHYAYAYDWLQGHPNFTATVKANLAKKLVDWSDKQFSDDTTKSSYIAQDSDHMTAATTSHFIAGVALFGDHPNASVLMDRGWTGVKEGYNNNSLIPYVSIEDMFIKTKNGHPLPGWDYYWMSDGWDLQNLFYVLDELGYVSNDVKNWWPKALISFIHNVDPSNTHYRWLGDTQSGVDLVSYSGYIWSGIANCIYMSERYGFSTEAAQGRFFLDNLAHTPWGIGEGDPLLFMARGYNISAKRINYTNPSNAQIPRYVVDGVGEGQRMGYGYFRSSWGKNGTWGGFSGVGNYLVDHMHAISGSFFLWRDGEYLTTDPHNYGGETVAQIYNSLSIPNPLKNDQGGPLFYSNLSPAFLERGYSQTTSDGKGDLFYTVLNANGSYNLPINKWDTCNGCGQPVNYYRRHFMYEGGDYIFVIDKVKLKYANYTVWRYRTQNNISPPTMIQNDLITAPSDKGNYRSLIKIVEPKDITWNFLSETSAWNGQVQNWQIDQTMQGYEIAANTTKKDFHLWISVIHIGKIFALNNYLDTATKISSDKMVGVAASSSILMVALTETLLTSGWYLTPNTTNQKTRHLVGDLNPGCYLVSGSKDGIIGNFSVKPQDNSMVFIPNSAGAQNISFVQSTCSQGQINNSNSNSSVNKCASVVCGGNSVCDANSGSCICKPGYSGTNCSTADLCYGKKCSNNGLCDPTNGIVFFPFLKIYFLFRPVRLFAKIYRQ